MGLPTAFLWLWLVVQLVTSAILFIGLFRFSRLRIEQRAEPLSTLEAQLVIPAFNEARHLATIEETIAAARAAGLGVVVVDDGSGDGSATRLAEMCENQSARFIRHPANLGKAAALRTAIGAANTEYVITIDADTTIDLGSLRRCVAGPEVGAVAVTICVADRRSSMASAQSIEYAYVLNPERAALAGFGVVLTVPGAASLWRLEALRFVGAFSSRTLAEDTDATLEIQMFGWRVVVAQGVAAITDCPACLRGMVRQRARWIWGNLQSAFYAGVTAARDFARG